MTKLGFTRIQLTQQPKEDNIKGKPRESGYISWWLWSIKHVREKWCLESSDSKWENNRSLSWIDVQHKREWKVGYKLPRKEATKAKQYVQGVARSCLTAWGGCATFLSKKPCRMHFARLGGFVDLWRKACSPSLKWVWRWWRKWLISVGIWRRSKTKNY